MFLDVMMVSDELEIFRRCFIPKFNEKGLLRLDRLQFELNIERAMLRCKATLALLELIADHFKYKWHDTNSNLFNRHILSPVDGKGKWSIFLAFPLNTCKKK